MTDAIVSIALERLASFTEQEVRLVVGVGKEVKKLQTTLGRIRDVLHDAEEKQVKEKSVKGWLKDLKDVAYDIDDLLDEWSTQLLKSQIERVDNAARPMKKVCSYFLSPCFGVNRLASRRFIGHRIKDIRGRLDEVDNEKNKYNFSSSSRSIEEVERPKTSSIVDISEVCGRAEAEADITSKLVSESSQNGMGHPVIISIVGMGGIGKTTLAQLAFNNENVKSHFGNRIWVCVSEPFDQSMIAKAIVKALGQDVPQDISWEDLHQRLCHSVRGKRFLLVLDDVWTEDETEWEPLNLSLKLVAAGSRILITTRNEGVSRMMGVTHPYILGVLSEQDCWSLLMRIAFWGREVEECKGLEEIGKEIAKKCKGLPLSAKAIGGLLRYKKTKQEWQEVLESKTWDLEKVGKRVLPALLLSYYDLPSHLKCCFTYCAIFPKDFDIQKDDLIQRWMAQGFISSKGNKELEIIGEEYFDNLMMRSFFQDIQRYGDEIRHCKMHDLVHDFAQLLTENECYIMESNDAKELNFSVVRHSTVIGEFDTNSTLSSLYNAKNLRTLKVIIRGDSISKLIPDLFNQFTCLRALDLSNTSIEKLPSEVEKLIHLRYLNLSYTLLMELPETVCNLVNLLTLKISGCSQLKKLPEGMEKLISLRHLENQGTYISYLPRGIVGLSSLRTLSWFTVADAAGSCKIGDLRNFKLLRGNLRIVGLERVANENEAKEAELSNKKHLRRLYLVFTAEECGSEVYERMEGVINGLQPPSNLKSLEVVHYYGTKFPNNWMIRNDGSVLCSNLLSLTLYRCEKCIRLPPSLGKLPSLEVLVIRGMDAVRNMGHEFFGMGDADYGTTKEHDGVSCLVAFPKLKTLEFYFMENWEEWDMTRMTGDDITIMPRLSSLTLYACSELKMLPHNLLEKNQNTPLRELVIRRCPILSRRYEKEKGEDYSKISHIPNIRISE